MLHCYHPQRSCGKVMYLHLFVILFTGGVSLTETPLDRDPLDRDPSPGQRPPAQRPPGQKPPLDKDPPVQ